MSARGDATLTRLVHGQVVPADELRRLSELDRKLAKAMQAAGTNRADRGKALAAELAKLIPDKEQRQAKFKAILQKPKAIKTTKPEVQKPADRWELHKFGDAMRAEEKPIDWIVEGLLAPGSVGLLAGDPGAKKTWALMDLALCVASGELWIGQVTRQCPVLWVDEELGRDRFERRLRKVGRGHSAEAKELELYYLNYAGCNFRDPGALPQLEAKMLETGAQFIVLDALVGVMSGADENAVAEVHPIFQGLRYLADKHKAAFFASHHFNKTGKFRGSTAIEGAVDVLVTLESTEGQTLMKFGFEKGNREEASQAFAGHAIFDDETSAFHMEQAGIGDAMPRLGKTQLGILKVLEHGQALTEVICRKGAKLTGSRPESVRQAIYSLQKLGLVKRTDGGRVGQEATWESAYNLSKKAKL